MFFLEQYLFLSCIQNYAFLKTANFPYSDHTGRNCKSLNIQEGWQKLNEKQITEV